MKNKKVLLVLVVLMTLMMGASLVACKRATGEEYTPPTGPVDSSGGSGGSGGGSDAPIVPGLDKLGPQVNTTANPAAIAKEAYTDVQNSKVIARTVPTYDSKNEPTGSYSYSSNPEWFVADVDANISYLDYVSPSHNYDYDIIFKASIHMYDDINGQLLRNLANDSSMVFELYSMPYDGYDVGEHSVYRQAKYEDVGAGKGDYTYDSAKNAYTYVGVGKGNYKQTATAEKNKEANRELLLGAYYYKGVLYIRDGLTGWTDEDGQNISMVKQVNVTEAGQLIVSLLNDILGAEVDEIIAGLVVSMEMPDIIKNLSLSEGQTVEDLLSMLSLFGTPTEVDVYDNNGIVIEKQLSYPLKIADVLGLLNPNGGIGSMIAPMVVDYDGLVKAIFGKSITEILGNKWPKMEYSRVVLINQLVTYLPKVSYMYFANGTIDWKATSLGLSGGGYIIRGESLAGDPITTNVGIAGGVEGRDYITGTDKNGVAITPQGQIYIAPIFPASNSKGDISEFAYNVMGANIKDPVTGITKNAGDGVRGGYAFTGAKMYFGSDNFRTPAVYERGEFELNIVGTKLAAGMSANPVQLYPEFDSIIRYDNSGNVIDSYVQAGLLNLELGLNLNLTTESAAQLSVGDVLGTLLDTTLGADLLFLKDLKFNFPEGGLSYDLYIDIRAKIDPIVFANTDAEIVIYFNSEIAGERIERTLIRIRLDNNKIFLDFCGLKNSAGQLVPNLMLGNIGLIENAIKSLMATEVLGKTIGALLDPEYSDHLQNAEDYSEVTGLDVTALIGIIAGNIKTEGDILSIKLNSTALSTILHMFLAGGTIGIRNVTISLDKTNILNTIRIDLDIKEGVSASVAIDKVKWFYPPVFVTDELDDNGKGMLTMSAGAYDLGYIDITDFTKNYYFGIVADGYIKIGTHSTSAGIGLDSIVESLLKATLNGAIGIDVGQAAELDIRYELKAYVNPSYDAFSNSGISLNFYVSHNGEWRNFLMAYYSADDDTLYIDLERISVLLLHLGLEESVGSLPKLKIENLGVREILKSLSLTLLDVITTLSNSALGREIQDKWAAIAGAEPGVESEEPFAFLGDMVTAFAWSRPDLMLAQYAEGDEAVDEEGGLNIGKLLEMISIDIGSPATALIVSADRQILATLLAMLNVLENGTAAPEINLSIKLQLIDPTEDGLVSVHFGIYEEGLDDEAIFADIKLINGLAISIISSAPVYMDIMPIKSDYIAAADYFDGIHIGLELEGQVHFVKSNSADTTYENEQLNDLITSLLNANTGIQIDISQFGINLGYKIQANVAVHDIMAIIDFVQGVTDNLPENLETEILLEINNNNNDTRLLGVYLIDSSIYIDLTYFGVSGISLSDISGFIRGIMLFIDNVTESHWF
ncbi:MAG: hypothetical protein LBN25_02710 [Christensenellaceae bacterium]|jgi:hypothetical protein|nr:hypothetical protein [Christensenellaceae bacterium]